MAGDSERKIIQFVNCRILKDHKIQKEDLWVREGRIVNPECVFFDEKVSSDVKIDCGNAIIAPGFIDLQINGGFGVDFSQPSGHFQKDLETVASGLLAHGVTSFCPTIVTSPVEIYHQIIPQTILKPGGKHGATILGLHLEGPFINPQKKGAHPEELIKTLDAGISTLLDTYGALETVRIITLAPEFSNAPAVIEELVKKNITVAIGHSMGNLVDGVTAVKHGATLITHLFNAMLPFHHRDPGLVGLLTSDEVLDGKTVYFGIISDGIHTHPAALRIAHRTHPEGLVLVTDAVSALGLQDGIHYIGRMAIEVRNSSAYVANSNPLTLCGSIASMNKCIQIFKQATNCSTVYALEAATLHPAKAIGIEKYKGTLNFGSDADFVLLDNDLQVLSTYIGGKLVYTSV